MKRKDQQQTAAIRKVNQPLMQKPGKRPDDLKKAVQRLELEVQERMNAEAALQHMNAELKALSRHSLRALEADRRSVAKQLHDNIGASLATIKFNVEALVSKFQSGGKVVDKELNEVIQQLAATIKESKQMATYLRPMVLDDFGLIATVGWLCRQFKQMHPFLTVESRISAEEEDIGEMLKIVCYRIIYEAMTNTAKHSNADRVVVSLKTDHALLRLKIQDNGQGFDQKSVSSGTDPLIGNGLAGMRECVKISGGRFYLTSQPGRGTRIEASFGLENQP